ncbi:MAG: hypothetical protein JSU06_06455 [Actinobacteria bacterium]|nr:hypothetical protein [Actinomycetota bacterium]
MFGRDWKHGLATVVAVNIPSRGRITPHLVADIEPEDGSPRFRAKFSVSFLNDGDMVALTPDVGQRVPVRFTDADHVKLDIKAMKAEDQQARKADLEALDALAEMPVDSPPG